MTFDPVQFATVGHFEGQSGDHRPLSRGPIAEPEDAQYVLERTHGVAGFFGASSMEHLPTRSP